MVAEKSNTSQRTSPANLTTPAYPMSGTNLSVSVNPEELRLLKEVCLFAAGEFKRLNKTAKKAGRETTATYWKSNEMFALDFCARIDLELASAEDKRRHPDSQ